MILKASQRGGGKQLGLHLMKTQDNEHIEVHEIRGFLSDDVVGAFKEAHAVSLGTRCKQFLFSVSLNPPPQEQVPVETFESTIARIEERTGLAGQPRVVVFHEKEGRRHAHAVWSRIDADTMTAINLPFYKNKLRDLSRELYIENGWKMPRGLMNSREADPRNFTLAEWHQAKRAGRDARDIKGMMQECWAVSDSKAAFMQALKARGFSLAQGDRRSHVALSPEGEVFSLSRMVGKKSKEIEKRLGDPGHLPKLAEAKAQLAKDLGQAFQRHKREADELKRRELAPLDAQRASMVQQHKAERSKLRTGLEQRWAEETRARSQRFDKGLKGLWGRMTGKHAEVQRQNEREAYEALARDRAQRQALIDAHMKDRQALQAKIRAVRDRHAAMLRDLREDKKVVQQMTREIEPKKDFQKQAAKPERQLHSTEDRLRMLREGRTATRNDRDRDSGRGR